jgi:hypothetical protein
MIATSSPDRHVARILNMIVSQLLLASSLLSCGSAGEYVAGQTPLHNATSGANDGPFNRQLDAYIAGLMKQWHIRGLAIAVVEGDDTYSKVWDSDS